MYSYAILNLTWRTYPKGFNPRRYVRLHSHQGSKPGEGPWQERGKSLSCPQVRLAQSGRAPFLQIGGRRFEAYIAHSSLGDRAARYWSAKPIHVSSNLTLDSSFS